MLTPAAAFTFCLRAPRAREYHASPASLKPRHSCSMSSARYTHGHAPSVLQSHRWRTAENSAAYLLPSLAKDSRVLDVGCGPGTITADFAKLCPAGAVAGVDSAGVIVDAAREDFPTSTFPNLVFQTADLMQLPFADDSFDVVHAHQVLQHVADPVGALVEMRRVCVPGGVVAARDADYRGFVWYPADARLDAWMTEYQTITKHNGGNPNIGRMLLKLALDAGFSDVTPSASVWCFADEETRAWWGGLWAGRVTESAFAEQMRARGVHEDELVSMASGWQAWAENPGSWFSVLHGEVLCRA